MRVAFTLNFWNSISKCESFVRRLKSIRGESKIELSKKAVTKLIIGFHIVTLGAVLFRVDTFPLTWVPMYSQFHGENDLVVPVGDKAIKAKGFEVLTAAGVTDFVNKDDLNIPGNAFRRIYYERAFGKGPPKHLREREALNPLSDAIFDLWYEDPAVSVDWESRLLNMLNVTTDRKPSDPNYIIQAIAVSDFAVLSREQRRRGDLSDLNIIRKKAVLKMDVEPNGEMP